MSLGPAIPSRVSQRHSHDTLKVKESVADSIIAVIAANIAKGKVVSRAVSEAFKFIEEATQGGEYFA